MWPVVPVQIEATIRHVEIAAVDIRNADHLRQQNGARAPTDKECADGKVLQAELWGLVFRNVFRNKFMLLNQPRRDLSRHKGPWPSSR